MIAFDSKGGTDSEARHHKRSANHECGIPAHAALPVSSVIRVSNINVFSLKSSEQNAMKFIILRLLCWLLSTATYASTLPSRIVIASNFTSETLQRPRLATLTDPNLHCLNDPYSTVIEEDSCRNALAKVPRSTQPHIYMYRSYVAVNRIALPIRYLSGELCCFDGGVIVSCRPRYHEVRGTPITRGPELV